MRFGHRLLQGKTFNFQPQCVKYESFPLLDEKKTSSNGDGIDMKWRSTILLCVYTNGWCHQYFLHNVYRLYVEPGVKQKRWESERFLFIVNSHLTTIWMPCKLNQNWGKEITKRLMTRQWLKYSSFFIYLFIPEGLSLPQGSFLSPLKCYQEFPEEPLVTAFGINVIQNNLLLKIELRGK